jgi:hypothetical protein
METGFARTSHAGYLGTRPSAMFAYSSPALGVGVRHLKRRWAISPSGRANGTKCPRTPADSLGAIDVATSPDVARLPDASWGIRQAVQVSDIVGLPLGLGSAIRRRRVFHPVGVFANGSIERLAPLGCGLPVESSNIVARMSKGVGLPGGLPDIVGLAWRMPPQGSATTPWDVLLASAGAGVVARYLLRPVTSWSGVALSSLMPLRYHGDNWWISARITTDIGGRGVSLASIETQIGSGGVQVSIEQARSSTGSFQPLATLTLDEVLPAGANDTAFDPTRYSAPEVDLFPAWLTDLRRDAYRRSRQGRAKSAEHVSAE